ncbi:hypothetical protein FKP32DRAFT_1599965 [Trametes sanguinea]|nr:hypothetical protein FKP32DRAFT_1599965 [Trametes sanguinea]
MVPQPLMWQPSATPETVRLRVALDDSTKPSFKSSDKAHKDSSPHASKKNPGLQKFYYLPSDGSLTDAKGAGSKTVKGTKRAMDVRKSTSESSGSKRARTNSERPSSDSGNVSAPLTKDASRSKHRTHTPSDSASSYCPRLAQSTTHLAAPHSVCPHAQPAGHLNDYNFPAASPIPSCSAASGQSLSNGPAYLLDGNATSSPHGTVPALGMYGTAAPSSFSFSYGASAPSLYNNDGALRQHDYASPGWTQFPEQVAEHLLLRSSLDAPSVSALGNITHRHGDTSAATSDGRRCQGSLSSNIYTRDLSPSSSGHTRGSAHTTPEWHVPVTPSSLSSASSLPPPFLLHPVGGPTPPSSTAMGPVLVAPNDLNPSQNGGSHSSAESSPMQLGLKWIARLLEAKLGDEWVARDLQGWHIGL